jgi:hypothetical protein
VDGQYSGAFGRWEHYEDFLITHARWLLGGDAPDDVFIDIDRQGQDALITVELDPQRPDRGSGEAPVLYVVPPGAERTDPLRPDFTWVGPDTVQARFRMDHTGSYRTIVVGRTSKSADGKDALADGGLGSPPYAGAMELARGPAVTLPYSPEFDPRDGLPSGAQVLAEIAQLSGGVARTDVLEVLKHPPRSARTSSLLPWLFGALVTFLLLEIAGRRLSLWDRLPEMAAAMVPDAVRRGRWLPRFEMRLPQRRAKAARTVGPAAPQQPSAPPLAPTTAGSADRPAPPVPKPAAEKPSVDVFAAAKERAKRRMK